MGKLMCFKSANSMQKRKMSIVIEWEKNESKRRKRNEQEE